MNSLTAINAAAICSGLSACLAAEFNGLAAILSAAAAVLAAVAAIRRSSKP